MTSDCTELSIERDEDHIVPVFENPKLYYQIVDSFSRGGIIPCILKISSGQYGSKSSYKNLNISNDWLIETSKGEKYLIVEADSSVGEQALAFGKKANSDLTLQEATQGFRLIEKKMNEGKGIKSSDKILRVLLFDTEAEIFTGGGNKFIARDIIAEKNSADIIIDTKLPLLFGIIHWASKYLKDDKKIVFDTNNKQYFASMKATLSRYGYRVIDRLDKEASVKDFPRIVYFDTTSDTINVVSQIIRAEECPPEKVCALLDKHEGIEEIEEMSREKNAQIGLVCSSTIYDSIFRHVRKRIREGKTPKDIQMEIDQMFTMKAK